MRHGKVHATDAQSVVDGDHDHLGLGELARDDVGLGHVEVAGNEAAAVRPDQATGHRSGERSVDPHWNVAVRTWRDGVDDVDVRPFISVDGRAERVEGCDRNRIRGAGGERRHVGDSWQPFGEYGDECEFGHVCSYEFRMEGVADITGQAPTML